MEGSGVVRRRQNIKREVFGKRSPGVEVQPAPIESLSGYLGFVSAGTVRTIHLRFVRALTMPNRRYAESHRPVSRLLENGGVSLVSHLIAVVFELLAERTQHWPSFVTRGAGHTVLPGKSGKCC